MNKTVLVVSLIIALLIGCIVGCVGAQLVVPPVRAGTNPVRWEYMCFAGYDKDDIVPKANRAGAQGWELTAAAGDGKHTLCFKRRLP